MEKLINKFCKKPSLEAFKKFPQKIQIMLYKYAQYAVSMETGNTLVAVQVVEYYTEIADTFEDYECGPECIRVFVYGTLLKGFHKSLLGL